MAESVMRQHMNERFGKVFFFREDPPLPRSLNIELNSGCNHRCVFCPFHGKYAPNIVKPAVIPFETVKRLLEEAHRLGIGEKEVGFYLAGEAFLYKELAEVVAYAKKLGFQYTFLTSNGALASPNKMKAVLDAGLDSIRFSINASDRESYREIHGVDDFERVVENLRYMRKYIDEKQLKVATSISCVITKKTLGIQKEFKRIFAEYVDDILFIPVLVNRLAPDEDFLAEHQLVDESNAKVNPDFICPMLFDTMYIGADLKIVPCCDAYDNNCDFFDLKEDFNLEHAWNCDAYRRYRNIFLKGFDDKGTICERCMLRMKGVERLVLDEREDKADE